MLTLCAVKLPADFALVRDGCVVEVRYPPAVRVLTWTCVLALGVVMLPLTVVAIAGGLVAWLVWRVVRWVRR